MHYSLNQIEHTCRKAVRGMGLEWGLAEDAGRAVRWLESRGLPGVSSLVTLLQSVDHHQCAKDYICFQETMLSASNGINTPLLIGPSLADWIGGYSTSENQEPNAFHVQNGLCPLLYIGYLGVVSLHTDAFIQCRWGSGQTSLSKNDFQITTPSGSDYSASGQDIYVDIAAQHRASTDHADNTISPAAQISAKWVEPTVWSALEKFAHHTYVEATEASRLAGAGAGLSDND